MRAPPRFQALMARHVGIRAFLREPLLHFLLIGLALFFVYDQVSPGDGSSRRIVVSQLQVEHLARQFQDARNRPPSPAELDGLVDTYVREEILYREGLAMGLDKDDAVIKRRVRQKYDLIAEETDRSAPTDADLAAYLKEHRSKFLQPAVVSFDQIYFDPGVVSPQDVAAVKAALAAGAAAAEFGQPSMLPRSVNSSSIDLVAREFGDEFARQLGEVPVGQWVGPVASGFGVHLVRVGARAVPKVPPLDRVRTAVAREWESDRRAYSRDTDYRKLRAEYDVVVKGNPRSATRP